MTKTAILHLCNAKTSRIRRDTRIDPFCSYDIKKMESTIEDIDAEFPDVIDLVNDDIDFDEMEQDIERFASEPAVRSILEKGVDLQKYSNEIAKDLEVSEEASINDYLRQVPRVTRIYHEIDSCDNALEAMEDLLGQFKNSLGKLATEICTLQTNSQEITVKLKNRKGLEKYLGEFTKNLTITKEFKELVLNNTVDQKYTKLLEELSMKIKFSNRKEIKACKSAQEARGPLEKLRAKASERLKKWIIAKTNELRDRYNVDQLSVQNSMMRCRYFSKFLKEHSSDIQESTKSYYIEVVSRIYAEDFRIACKRIPKQMALISTMDERIVPTNSGQHGYFKPKKGSTMTTLFFSIGERQRLLDDVVAPPQIFSDGSYPIEALMRSLYQHLIDAVTAEHAFASEFYIDDNITAAIFNPTAKILETFLDELLESIFDPICIVILLRIAIAHKTEMEKRRVFKIDHHLTTLQKKLTNRFKAIIALNRETIENCPPSMFIDNEETAIHANSMTKRFAEFATSLSLLMAPEIEDMLTIELHDIASSVISLLDRTSREFKSPHFTDIFMLNNFYLVISTLRTIDGCILLNSFQQMFIASQEHYIDLVLYTSYKKLVDVVRKAFTRLETREDPVNPNFGESELKEIAVEFKQNHIEIMKKIADDQIMKFDDFSNGKEILKEIAKRLVLYWAKFDQLCKYNIKNNPPWFSNLISAHQLVCDILPIADSF